MVRTLLAAEEVSEQLLRILAEKSEGNPLYVEEILRQLQETRGILVEDGEARLRRPDEDSPRLLKRSEEHTSELQSLAYLVCRLLLEKKKKKQDDKRVQSNKLVLLHRSHS